MKRWIHAATENDRQIKMIADECIIRLKDDNTIDVKGSKTRDLYKLHALENGDFAIEDADENIIAFDTVLEVAAWLAEN